VTLEPPMAAAKAVNPGRNKRRSRPKRPSVALNPRKKVFVRTESGYGLGAQNLRTGHPEG